jgi:serine/threonine-protein kinase PpkA
LSLALALDVCIAICSALEVAHRKGFVHRDIKPQNILFREDGAPVLTDFGIARAIDVGTSLTVAGMFVGTPAYMSPEQVKGLDVDARTDLYSLGMVFYEMLTGNVPFRSDSDSALSIAMKQINETLPPLPPEYAQYQPIIDRLTAKDREQRFASATEVLHALRSMNDGTSPRAHTLVRTESREKTVSSKVEPSVVVPTERLAVSSRKAWWPWAAGIAVLAIVGVAVTTMLGRPQQPVVSEANVSPTLTPAETTASKSSAEIEPTASRAGVESAIAPAPVSEPIATTAGVAPAIERPKETPAQPRQRQIDKLLAQAQADMDRGALTLPQQNNAADRYRQVLQLDPSNAEASAGLRTVATRLEEEVDRARRENKVAEAQNALDQLRAVEPSHPRLAKLQADIGERKMTLDRRDRRANEKASEHIARVQQLLARSPLVLRSVADAHDHYDTAKQLAPDSAGLVGMKDRIFMAYETAARYELERKEPKRALNVIAYARKRDVATPGLQELEHMANAVLKR